MAATDDYATYQQGLDSPARHLALITPSDSTDLPHVSRAILVGTAGDIKVTTVGGETLIVPSVPVGQWSVAATRVWSTGTVASNLTAMW